MTSCPQPLFGFLAHIANLVVDLAEKTHDELVILADTFSPETKLREYAVSRMTSVSTGVLLTDI